MSRFAIVTGVIETATVERLVARPSAGAIVTFAGAVRDHNEGRAVTLLEYQAYDSMAVREMERLALEIESALPEVRLAAQHRTGALAVGDLAVVCCASAPHRGEAFDACRRFIDAIKAHVPVWKREHGPDGPYWVGWEDARCLPGHAHDHDHDHGRDHGRDRDQ